MIVNRRTFMRFYILMNIIKEMEHYVVSSQIIINIIILKYIYTNIN